MQMVNVRVRIRRGTREDSEATEGASCDSCRFFSGDRCSKANAKVGRFDSCPLFLPESKKIKRIVKWRGLSIGQTHDIGDLRHGTTMSSGYGHLRKSYGHAPDGLAIDFYLGDDLDSPELYKVRQIDPDSGKFDEYKYFVGFRDPMHVKSSFCAHSGASRFGGVEKCSRTELQQYREDACGCPTEEHRRIQGLDEVPDHLQAQLADPDLDPLPTCDRILAATYPDPIYQTLSADRYAPDSARGQFSTPSGLLNFHIRRNRVGWVMPSAPAPGFEYSRPQPVEYEIVEVMDSAEKKTRDCRKSTPPTSSKKNSGRSGKTGFQPSIESRSRRSGRGASKR